MHLLLSVSVLPSLREITPLSLSRVYAPPNCAPLYRCQSTVALNWAVGGPASAPLPLLGFLPPQCVPLSLNAYTLYLLILFVHPIIVPFHNPDLITRV